MSRSNQASAPEEETVETVAVSRPLVNQGVRRHYNAIPIPTALQAHPQRRTVVALALVALLSGALIVLLLARVVVASQGIATTAPLSPLIGHPAPDFTIQTWTWDGAPSQSVHLAALHGHVVVINFWASWCDACRAEEPALEAAYQRYQAKGVIFIGVAFDDTRQNGVPFLQQYQVTFPSGPDVTGAISINYGLTGVPETVFIDRSGIVRQKWVGGITDGDRNIATVIDSLLSSASQSGAHTCFSSASACAASVALIRFEAARKHEYGVAPSSVDRQSATIALFRRALT